MTSQAASAAPFVDDQFLVRQRAELVARRRAYREQLERLSVAVDELGETTGAPDLGDDEGFAEADPINVERDQILSLRAIARQRLDEVDAALTRLEAGTYGACRTCRHAISIARLEAVPEASQCITCASGTALRRR
ncbi:MAG TPA: TraR/DksA C4-type zinc finger protein [Acidimicrobiales bacterium]|jgi:RNA polymerase-binding transcription factor DksA|nr:TraR/DksA C4-type zinc finger protein [Acidimicrobiales bacterium]